MDQNEHRRERARTQVAFTDRISAWLRRSGVQDADVRATLAVGVADFLDAARTAGAHLAAMLSEDPTHPESADRALEHAGAISAYLFGEAKDHLLELEALWDSQIEERLAALGTSEPLNGE